MVFLFPLFPLFPLFLNFASLGKDFWGTGDYAGILSSYGFAHIIFVLYLIIMPAETYAGIVTLLLPLALFVWFFVLVVLALRESHQISISNCIRAIILGFLGVLSVYLTVFFTIHIITVIVSAI